MKLNEKQLKDRSKFLSLVLRHRPETIRIELDAQGWTDVATLLEQIRRFAPAYVLPFDLETLHAVVSGNDKKRFSFNEDQTRIRASQGHSVSVDLGYEAQEPPESLYHGTTHKNLESIRVQGILKGRRHHVHLSPDLETATRVGQRHGAAVILTVESGRMHRENFLFYCSANGVWLTDEVPPEYIRL